MITVCGFNTWGVLYSLMSSNLRYYILKENDIMKIMKEIGVYIESGSDIIPKIEQKNYVECPKWRTRS